VASIRQDDEDVGEGPQRKGSCGGGLRSGSFRGSECGASGEPCGAPYSIVSHGPSSSRTELPSRLGHGYRVTWQAFSLAQVLSQLVRNCGSDLIMGTGLNRLPLGVGSDPCLAATALRLMSMGATPFRTTLASS
jgi:hypothetical protein